jgi:hypothetical protein
MIHFDFVVDDVDAENIIGCIDAAINKCVVMKHRGKMTKPYVEWFEEHMAYLEELKSKMKNTRIDERES